MAFRIYSQAQDHTCFVVALANCYSYLGLKQDAQFQRDIRDLKAECASGPILVKEQAVRYLKLDKYIYRTPFADNIKIKGGILSIMHPIFNLHATFIVRCDDVRCVAYNSWLGPNSLVVCWPEMIDLAAAHNCCGHWAIK